MKTLKNPDSAYLLEESVEHLHKESLTWLSEINLWKKEVTFFQKLLDNYAPKFSETADKQKIDHFQNMIIYYNGELLDEFEKNIRNHERMIARQMAEYDVLDETDYRKIHADVRSQINSFKNVYFEYKSDFFKFLEPVLR